MAEGNRLPSILSVQDVARTFRVHHSVVRKLLNDGRLRGWRIGSGPRSRWRIPLDSVMAFVERGQGAGPEWLARFAAERRRQDAA